MLLLCFSFGDERFALDTTKVVELIPLVSMRRIPKAPEWVAGVICYHGQTLPVIDLCALNIARKAKRHLSTRIILVRFTATDKEEHLLGLLAEQVTETLHRERQDFSATGICIQDTPYLGGITRDKENMLQWVEIDRLLPGKVQALLFQDKQDAGR